MDDCERPWGFWDLNLAPLKQVLSIAEPFHLPYFNQSCILYKVNYFGKSWVKMLRIMY